VRRCDPAQRGDSHGPRPRFGEPATFDARGTLGMDAAVPVGIQGLLVTVEVSGDVEDDRLERLARTTERYCVVGQSLREPARVVVRRAR